MGFVSLIIKLLDSYLMAIWVLNSGHTSNLSSATTNQLVRILYMLLQFQ